jgi:hypothetical protein
MRGGAVVLVALGVTGCITHWETQQGPPALVVSRTTATEFRVTRKDGTRVNVDQAHVEGDSLIGRPGPVAAWPDTSARIAIPLAEIYSIAQQEADVAASVAIGTVVTLGIFLILLRGGVSQ